VKVLCPSFWLQTVPPNTKLGKDPNGFPKLGTKPKKNRHENRHEQGAHANTRPNMGRASSDKKYNRVGRWVKEKPFGGRVHYLFAK